MNFPRAAKAAGAVAVILALAAALASAMAYSRRRAVEARTRDWIVRLLRQRFRSDVELRDLRVRVFPRIEVSGEGLSLHYWAAPGAPPLMRIEKFSFALGLFGIFRVPHQI